MTQCDTLLSLEIEPQFVKKMSLPNFRKKEQEIFQHSINVLNNLLEIFPHTFTRSSPLAVELSTVYK